VQRVPGRRLRRGLGRYVDRVGVSFRSWTTTVQALSATMAMYHIRYLFAHRSDVNLRRRARLKARMATWLLRSSKEVRIRPTTLLQLRVLRLGFFQDGDVRVGVLPEREEMFVGGECPDPGCVGVCPLRGSRLQGVGASHAQMRRRSRPAVPDDATAAVVEIFWNSPLCLRFHRNCQSISAVRRKPRIDRAFGLL
jgi:hypothetical protein